MGRDRQPFGGSPAPGRPFAPDIDFALEIDESDEDLPTPSDLDRPWVRRTRWPAYGLLASLVLGVIVLDHSRRGDRPAARPEPRATRAGEIVTVAPPSPPDRTADGLISDSLGLTCPDGRTCRTSATVPAGVLAALNATFPGHAGITVRTLSAYATAGQQLVGRFVHTANRTSDVTVQVFPGHLPAAVTASGGGGGSLAVVQVAAPGRVPLTIRITVGGPGATASPKGAPVRLARDPRLLQLP